MNTHTHWELKVQKNILDVHSVQAIGHIIFNINTILVPKSKSKTMAYN